MSHGSTALTVITTHPIQYYVPLYREIFSRPGVSGEVLFASRHGSEPGSFDPGFGREVQWDQDLLSGYPHRFLGVRHRFGRSSADSVRWLTDVDRQIGKRRQGVLLVAGYRPLLEAQALVTAFAKGVPVMMRPDGFDRPGVAASPKRLLRSGYLHWLYQRIGVYLSVGKRSTAHFAAHGGDPSKVVASPYCVDNSRFSAATTRLRPDRASLRRDLGLAPDTVVIAFVAKQIHRKRPGLLAEAVAGSKHKHSIEILWIGSGPEQAKTESYCRAHGVRSRFLGFVNQSELPRCYVAADLHVLPSDEETWGLVVNETMAAGLPQIVTRGVGCGDDLIEGQGTGRIVGVDDLAALRSAIDLCVEKPEERQAMGRRCQEVVESNNVARAADGIIEGVRRLAAS